MKKIFLLWLLFKSVSVQCQEIKAFIKSPDFSRMTLSEFNNQDIIQLSDTSLKVYSYNIYFNCDDKYLNPKEDCNVSLAAIDGNSLKHLYVRDLVKKYKSHFYVVLDMVKYLDKNGELKIVANPPQRIDITE